MNVRAAVLSVVLSLWSCSTVRQPLQTARLFDWPTGGSYGPYVSVERTWIDGTPHVNVAIDPKCIVQQWTEYVPLYDGSAVRQRRIITIAARPLRSPADHDGIRDGLLAERAYRPVFSAEMADGSTMTITEGSTIVRITIDRLLAVGKGNGSVE